MRNSVRRPSPLTSAASIVRRRAPNRAALLAVAFAFLQLAGRAAAEPLEPGTGEDCEPTWIATAGGAGWTNYEVLCLRTLDTGAGPALYAGGFFATAGGSPTRYVGKWDGTGWSTLGSGMAGSPVNGVWDLAVFDAGDGAGAALFAGGDFTSAGGVPARSLARWDGSNWSAVAHTMDEASGNPRVKALAVFDDGNGPALYAGGSFTSIDGQPLAHVARWNGSIWSPLGAGANGEVDALTVFDDGSGRGPALYAGGGFTSAGGAPANRIAKWDGTAWSPLGGGTNGPVLALKVHDEGTGSGPALYVGGSFSQASAASTVGIARWDGGSWSSVGGGMGGSTPSVRCIESFDDGSGSGLALFAGGDFIIAGSHNAKRVARWNGTSWSALPAGIYHGMNYSVDALATFDDGLGGGPELYAGGIFTEAGGLPANRIARWKGAGWRPLGHGLDATVYALAVHEETAGSGSRLFVGGRFTFVGDLLVHGIARWDGSTWSDLAGGMSGNLTDPYVASMCLFDDGAGGGRQLYAGGRFNSAGGIAVNAVGRWDGTAWHPLGIGIWPGDFSYVNALAAHEDASGISRGLYAAGYFWHAGGVDVSHVAKWDGTAWSALGSGLTSDAYALAIFDDGSGSGPALYAGGKFGAAGGTTVHGIARWDGSSWSALAGGVAGGFAAVHALLVFDDGGGPALFAGGDFTQAGGVPANCVAKWDGNAWSALGDGMDDTVFDLIEYDDGTGHGSSLYAGGRFSHAGDASANGMARWDGAHWHALGGGMIGVDALAVWDGGSPGVPELFVGGGFQTSPARDGYLSHWGGCTDSRAGTPYCFGDGSGTPCPCGNAGASGHGCANGSFASGASLVAVGDPSVAADAVELHAFRSVPNQPGLFVQGDERKNGGDGAPFGDGLRCARGSIVRIEIVRADEAGFAAPTVSLVQAGGVSAGEVRRYQWWYRDPHASPCGALFNLSNGVEIDWQP